MADIRALLIAEKPDLMRKVKDAYFNNGFKDQIEFASFHGHLMQLYSPNDYDEKWEKWSLETLPIIPDSFKYKVADKDSVDSLKKTIKDGHFDYLINCCDPDREGQHIFYSFYETIGCKLPVKRMWHADLTEKELMRALNNMEDDLHTPRLANLTAASKLRAQMDWLVGMNASRIVSIKRNSLARIGRVVTPTFKILCDREREIRNFVPVTNYGVEADFDAGYRGEYYALNNENKSEAFRFAKKEDAEDFIRKLPKDGVIKNIEKSKAEERSPQLPSIADLQMQANRLYGYTLDKTLETVQSLYEKKIVSYPRTDCCHVTKAIAADFDKILDVLSSVRELREFTDSISKTRIDEIANDKRYVDDSKVTAHYAVIPTGVIPNEAQLSNEEKIIFELIAKRFISIFMDPFVCDKTKIETAVEKYSFMTFGSLIRELGWKKLFNENIDSNEILPDVKINTQVKVEKAEVVDHTSKAPSRYTDASLLNAMINAGNLIDDKELAKVLKGDKKVKDSGGIGTPATRAAIVEKIVMPIKKGTSVYYLAQRKGKTFSVTDEGLDLISSLDNFSIASPKLTAIWEQDLRRVEDGEISDGQFTDKMLSFTNSMCKELMEGRYTVTQGSGGGEKKYAEGLSCPNCGGKILERDKFYMCENYSKEDGGCKFAINKSFNKAKITTAVLKDICEGRVSKPLKMHSEKSDKDFTCALKYNKETKKIEFVFDETAINKETKHICPVCGKPLLEKDGNWGKYLACTNKDFTLSLNVCGHKLSSKEIAKLLAGERTDLVEGMKGKSGKEFSAYLKLNDGKIAFEFPPRN